MKDKILDLDLDQGRFRRISDDEIEIDLVVRKRVTDSDDYVRQTIKGVLSHKLCFAGKVRYWDPRTGHEYFGGMILVDHLSITDEKLDIVIQRPNVRLSSYYDKS